MCAGYRENEDSVCRVSQAYVLFEEGFHIAQAILEVGM